MNLNYNFINEQFKKSIITQELILDILNDTNSIKNVRLHNRGERFGIWDEVCEVKHLNIVGYRRRLHGSNTSLVDSKEQIQNTAKVVNSHLIRLSSNFTCELLNEDTPVLAFNKGNNE